MSSPIIEPDEASTLTFYDINEVCLKNSISNTTAPTSEIDEDEKHKFCPIENFSTPIKKKKLFYPKFDRENNLEQLK